MSALAQCHGRRRARILRALAEVPANPPAPTEWNEAHDPRCRLSGRHNTHAPTGALDPDGNRAAVELSPRPLIRACARSMAPPARRRRESSRRPRSGAGQCRVGEWLCGEGIWNGEFIPRSAERGADRFSRRALLVGHLLVCFVVEIAGERRALLFSQSGQCGEYGLQLFVCQQHALGVGIRVR